MVELIVSALFDFVRLLIVFSILFLVLYKIFKPIHEKIMEKYKLSWITSLALLNFVITLVSTTLVYFYFFNIGVMQAQAIDIELQLDLYESILIFLRDFIRIIIGSAIIAVLALVFEFIASLSMSYLEGKEKSELAQQVFGVLVAGIVFWILLLFLFDFVLLGLFVFIFYGGVGELPLLMIFGGLLV